MAKSNLNDKQRAFLKWCKQSYSNNIEEITSRLEMVTGFHTESEVLKECRDAIKDYDEGTVVQLNRINKNIDILELKGSLKDAYDNLPNTPIDAPELYFKDIEELSDNMDDFYDDVFRITGIDPDQETDAFPAKYSLDYLDSFVAQCVKKINSLKDENGFYKKTDALVNAKMITFSKRRELTKVREPIEKLNAKKVKKINSIEFPSDPTVTNMNIYSDAINEVVLWHEEEMKPLHEKWMKAVYSATEIKEETLSEWEKKLLEHGYVLTYIYKEVNTPS